MTNDTLQAAISALGAQEVAPIAPCSHLAECPNPSDCGMARRFAYYSRVRDHEGWQVCCRAALLSLAKVTETEGGAWEAVSAKRLPSWWTPERRFAWRVIYVEDALPDEIVPDEAEVRIRMGEATVAHYERITADLSTGEEIPA